MNDEDEMGDAQDDHPDYETPLVAEPPRVILYGKKTFAQFVKLPPCSLATMIGKQRVDYEVRPMNRDGVEGSIIETEDEELHVELWDRFQNPTTVE